MKTATDSRIFTASPVVNFILIGSPYGETSTARARRSARIAAENARRAAAEQARAYRAALAADIAAAIVAALAEQARAAANSPAAMEARRASIDAARAAHAARVEQARAIDEQARRAPARKARKTAAEMNADEMRAAAEQAAPFLAPFAVAEYNGDRAAHAVKVAFYAKLKGLNKRGASAAVCAMYFANADDYLTAGYVDAADAIRKGNANVIGAALHAFDKLENATRAHDARITPPIDEKDGPRTPADAIAVAMHERETRRRIWQSAAARLAGDTRAARAARIAARAIITGASMPQGVYKSDVEKAVRVLRDAAAAVGIFDDIVAEYTRRAAARTHAAPAADTIAADAIRAAHIAAAVNDAAADAARAAADAVFMAGGTLPDARAAQARAAADARKQARAAIVAFNAAAAEKARIAADILNKRAPAPACDWFKK